MFFKQIKSSIEVIKEFNVEEENGLTFFTFLLGKYLDRSSTDISSGTSDDKSTEQSSGDVFERRSKFIFQALFTLIMVLVDFYLIIFFINNQTITHFVVGNLGFLSGYWLH